MSNYKNVMSILSIKKIAAATTLATYSLFFSPVVLAFSITFGVSGIFDDGGTIEGTFNYDSDLNSYSNIEIETTTGSIVIETNYDDINDSIISTSANGFSIEDGDTLSILNLVFNPDLNNSNPILDTTNSYEDDFINQKDIVSGSVTAVPFEFSPSLGLFLLLSIFGTQKITKKVACLNNRFTIVDKTKG